MIVKYFVKFFAFSLIVSFAVVLFSCRLGDNKVRGSIGSDVGSENPGNGSDPISPIVNTPSQAPTLNTLSSESQPTAIFQSSLSDHSHFECRVDNGIWFLCTSPFNISDNGSVLPPGFSGQFSVRSVNQSGQASNSVTKPFRVGMMPRGFNDVVNGVTVLSNSNRVFYGKFTHYQPEHTKGIALLTKSGNYTYSPIFGFDGSTIYSMIYERDTSNQLTGKILVGGDFTSYRGVDVPDKLIRLNSDGTWDNTFNSGGIGFTGFHVPYLIKQETDLSGQSTGKFLIGTSSFGTPNYNGSSVPGGIIRLNNDGTVDSTFNNGMAGAPSSTIMSIEYEFAAGGMLTGKLIIAGTITSYNGTTKSGIVRINSDGSLDTTWNTGQIGPNNWVYSVLPEFDSVTQLPTGRIIAAGDFDQFNGANIPKRIMRLNSNGSLDATFNNGGLGGTVGNFDSMKLSYDIDASGQFTGKYIYLGHIQNYNGPGVGKIFRILANGALDTTFNPAGSGLTPFSSTVIPRDLLHQKDENGQLTGNLIITGGIFNYNGASYGKHILGLNSADGLPSSSFNTNKYSFDLQGRGLFQQQLIDGSYTGNIWVYGDMNIYGGVETTSGLAVLTKEGVLDSTFSGGSGFTFASGATAEVLNVIEDFDTNGDPTGKILVSGSFDKYQNTSVSGGIVRLNFDGSLDTTFNNGTSGVTNPQAVHVEQELNTSNLPTGKYFLFGGNITTYNGSGVPRGIIRINNDGSWDSSFNSGGSGILGSQNALHVILQEKSTSNGMPTGKIIIGGQFTSYNGSSSIPRHLIRLNSDGSFDASFNGISSGFNFLNTDVLVIEQELNTSTGLPTGNLLVGGDLGTTYNGVAITPGLVRLSLNGLLDSTFNNGGSGANGFVFSAKQIRQSTGLPSSEWIISGNFTNFNGDTNQSRIAKLDANGNLITAFNSGQVGVNTGTVFSITQFKDSDTNYFDQFSFSGSFGTFNNELRPYIFVTNSLGVIDEFQLGSGR